MTNNLVEATNSLFGILEPLSPEDRRRIIKAALVLLGDDQASNANPVSKSGDAFDEVSPVRPKAAAWIKKKGLSMEAIQQYFHTDGGRVDVISLPSSATSSKDKTLACYLMAGLASYLSSDEPTFTDEAARALCTNFGCYSAGNHATYLKSIGNRAIGTKATGWRLTAPGLDSIADLMKVGSKAND